MVRKFQPTFVRRVFALARMYEAANHINFSKYIKIWVFGYALMSPLGTLLVVMPLKQKQ